MSAPTVVLSPHFDDAVLSCWHVLSQPGEVTVVNVFAGVPEPGRLGWWDRLGGASDSAAAVRSRIEEDRRALELLGRAPVNLSFLDKQYRDTPQPPGAIADAVRERVDGGTVVYAPAGLGSTRHEDHLAVRRAALELPGELRLYADLPHANMDGWPGWVSGDGERAAAAAWREELRTVGIEDAEATATVHRLTPDERSRKLEALAAYTSQVPILERIFDRSLSDPALLGYEVEWALPAADSSASAAARNPSASA